MLFDLEFQENKKGRLKYRRHGAEGACWASGDAIPRFFDAKLTNGGVLRVPKSLYGEVDT